MTATDTDLTAAPVLVLWRTVPPASARVEQAGWHSDVVYGAPSARLALTQVMLAYCIAEEDLLEAACYDLPGLLARDGADSRLHGQRTDTEAVAARMLAEADQLRAWREAQPGALTPSAQLHDLHASLGMLADALLDALNDDQGDGGDQAVTL